jgi:hypothetical protein
MPLTTERYVAFNSVVTTEAAMPTEAGSFIWRFADGSLSQAVGRWILLLGCLSLPSTHRWVNSRLRLSGPFFKGL